MRLIKILAVSALLSSFFTLSATAANLQDVTQHGALRCGVNPALSGFSTANSLGEYSGFDVDLCRAVASAVFNDTKAVEMVPLSAAERFTALQSGTIDILSRNTTWTLGRNTQYGEFAGISFFDGQGFMVRRSSGIRSALELDRQPICVSANTTSELNASDFFAVSDMRFQPVFYPDQNAATKGYIEGRCKALTTDRSSLAAQRANFTSPEEHTILPEVISKEPLGPMVPSGSSQWENIVRWTLNCMINAEELGVNSQNVNKRSTASTPSIRRLLGNNGNTGAQLGLHPQWCKRVIAQVGNYGEIYDRNIGPDTPVGMRRGINELWSNGGLIYAPPMR